MKNPHICRAQALLLVLFLTFVSLDVLAQARMGRSIPGIGSGDMNGIGDMSVYPGGPAPDAPQGMDAASGAARQGLQRNMRPDAARPDLSTPPPPAARPQQPAVRDSGRAAAPAAAPETNQFQGFIERETGLQLPMFGANLFRDAPSTFAPIDDAPVSSDYVIGPGDEIILRIWGQVDGDIRTFVNRAGTISIPKVGQLRVAGLTYQDLGGAIRTAISRVYRNFELSVELGQLRSIQVYVVGSARAPGTYALSSMSTLLSAVFSVGGPSSRGSMRHIVLKRSDKVVTELDLYDLLVTGDKSRDVPLQPGDVIFFAPVGPLAALAGDVNNPAVFELAGPNASVDQLIAWAGGLATTAATGKVTLERFDARRIRQVDEFALDAQTGSKQVRDGDLLRIYAISPRFNNAVALRGFVEQPIRTAWRAGMRVSDLIPDKTALIARSFWFKRNQVEMAGARAHTLEGSGQSVPGSNGRAESGRSRSGNLARLPGDEASLRRELKRMEEVNWDYAVVERIQDDLSTALMPFNLGKAILEGDPANNLELRPGDIVTVFSKSDIDVPVAKQSRYVRLEGEFRAAGVYKIEPGETLRQVVARIGGVTDNAYLYASEFTRESTRASQQEQLKRALDRMEQEAASVNLEVAGQNTTTDDEQQFKASVAARQALIAKLRTIKATGRIVLHLPPDTHSASAIPDLVLEDGDRLFIPSKPSEVSVFGSVFNQNAFIHGDDRRVGDYLDLAGGPTKNADKSQIYLLRANGEVVSAQSAGWFRGINGQAVMPGDAIVVPEKFERYSFTRELRDWSQIFYQFALGVGGLKVLKNL
ncbi:MAG: SLBB domain-containing protein [Rhodocyclaceae bacterium]|nr:SLBB domain-containing protein [Rhodocyclaceae bacterium]